MIDEPITGDLQLLRKVASGDKRAFESLFRLYHPRVYRFSFQMLQDHHQAEEVVCDTLHAVWKGASNFRQESAVSSWILGIAYRRSLKSYRQYSRHSNRLESEVELEELVESSPGGNPETFVNNELQGRQLIAAFARLSADHRAVLELIASGHSVAEIAGIVGCPENTVKTRTFHARRKLRSVMQE